MLYSTQIDVYDQKGDIDGMRFLLHVKCFSNPPRKQGIESNFCCLLHQAMQKIFALLLAELKKLGANVVFADFSHNIVETGKHQLAAAQGYCDYLVKILKSR
jgi:DNA polymerase epsilon subunit 1